MGKCKRKTTELKDGKNREDRGYENLNTERFPEKIKTYLAINLGRWLYAFKMLRIFII